MTALFLNDWKQILSALTGPRTIGDAMLGGVASKPHKAGSEQVTEFTQMRWLVRQVEGFAHGATNLVRARMKNQPENHQSEIKRK